MEQINNTNRCCATCTYWLGYRNPNRLGYVEVGCRMDHGQCAAHWPDRAFFKTSNL